MNRELIIINEFTKYAEIEPQFITLLEENELIRIYEVENERYIHHDDLPEIEKYARMYYELSINMEGIDAIHHLLDRIGQMQEEMRNLKNKLNLLD